jgi:predicted nucleic acid-binding protein
MIRVYLDNCALNRPFDDQRQERVRLETEAIVLVLSRVERREWTSLGSQALEIEIDQTPDAEQQSRLKRVVEFIESTIEIGEKELKRANELQAVGFVGFDAVHLACAESGKADVFLTTDDRLLKTAKRLAKKLRVKVENPLDWMKENIE